MKCDGSPDPTIPGEINTYINLRIEDRAHDNVEAVLEASKLDISVRPCIELCFQSMIYVETYCTWTKKLDRATYNLFKEILSIYFINIYTSYNYDTK